jgi:hypothetical protein
LADAVAGIAIAMAVRQTMALSAERKLFVTGNSVSS